MKKLNRLFVLTIVTVVAIAACLIVSNFGSKISIDNPARKLVEKIESGEDYRIDGKSIIQRNGTTLEGEMTIAGSTSEKRTYMDQLIDINGSESRVIAFSDHEKRTVIMTTLESITLGTVDVSIYDKRNKKTEESVGMVDGRRLPYIGYESDENMTSKYYIDGDKLYALEMKKQSGGDTITLIIDKYSTEIPDEFFQIPTEYADYHTVDNR